MDNITILREALTDALVTLQNVYGYALMDAKVLEQVLYAIEHCESTLQLTDEF